MNKAVRSLESEFIYVNVVFCGEALHLVWNSLFLTMWGGGNKRFCRVLSIEQSKRDVATYILTWGEGKIEGRQSKKEHKFVALCVY